MHHCESSATSLHLNYVNTLIDGSNPHSIVFDDADLEKAVESAAGVKFRCSGQVCIAANRLLVQAGIHDRFVEALKAKVASFKVGYGLGKLSVQAKLRTCPKLTLSIR